MPELSDDAKQATIERWDRVFRTLSAEPRRQIVVALTEAPADRALSLPEAANPSSPSWDPGRLTVELVHSHLPMLARGDYVRWERDPFTVERGPAFEEVAVVFEALDAHADGTPAQLAEGCQRVEERRRNGS